MYVEVGSINKSTVLYVSQCTQYSVTYYNDKPHKANPECLGNSSVGKKYVWINDTSDKSNEVYENM